MEVINIENISVLERKTIVTVGMFDGVHCGHRLLLERLLTAAAESGLMPVVVTFDRHPKVVLSPDSSVSLLSTYDERMSLLESCGVSNVVIVHFDNQTASLSACHFAEQYLCRKLNMRELVLGYDNQFGCRMNDDFAQLPQLAQRMGFSIRRVEPVEMFGVAVSSTKIRKALAESDIEKANAMLGSSYSASGVVVHGRHVGTSLGFPTANIKLDDSLKLLPAEGVYALRVRIGDEVFVGMANLGTQPTFDSGRVELEVHLIGFEGDLYGRRLTVEFVGKVRDIQTFPSVELLVSQLRRDMDVVKSMVELKRC